MNQQLYRIVFNTARGILMAVAETAGTQGKAGERRSVSVGRKAHRAGAALSVGLHRLQPLAVAMASAWLLISIAPDARAQIVSDPGAPANQRPTVLTTGSGNNIPLVNIQTPSAAGVSRNTYNQFDVTGAGAVLNNSRTNVQTQLGGWVQANPWLATGSAKVILNEVNSSNPSQLRGAIEVAGQRAEVIIANPSGIQVDGAGFINTSRATLTTGTPMVNGGNLDGYRVQTGTVRITGNGLDASNTDSAAILARAIEVNAGIWAKQLSVTTGANNISADASTTTATTGTGNKPSFALDVAAIGGMYAGKITLVGTEAGLGVRNAGVIQANAGDLVLSADGWLSNTGSLSASQNLSAQTSGAITNSGTVYASGNTALTSAGNITNSGLIAAQGDTRLSSSSAISNTSGAVLAAGLTADNTLGSSGSLAIAATGTTTLAGQSLAGSDVQITGTSVNVASGQLSGHNLSLSASAGDVNATGATLVASQTLIASTAQTLRTDGAVLSAGQLVLRARDLSNVSGQLVQTGNVDLALNFGGNLDNTSGTIATNGDLALSTTALNNTLGNITSNQSASLNTSTRLDNTDGTIAANQHLGIGGANLINTRGRVQATHGSATLVATDISNSAGTVLAGNNLDTQVLTLSNTGSMYAGGSQTLVASGSVNNSGVIAARGDTTLTAQSLSSTATSLWAAGLESDGSLADTGNLSITTTQNLIAHGQNLAAGSASLHGTAIDVAGSQTSATTLTLSATVGTLNATEANLLAAKTLSASSVQTLLTDGATVSAQQIQLDAHALSNVGGQIVQTGNGDFRLNLAGHLDNSGGVLQTAGLASITAQSLDNDSGSLSGTTVSIATSGAIHNTGTGLISAVQDLTLATASAGAELLNQGRLQAGHHLSANSSAGLTNTGTFYAGANARVVAAGTLNNGGVIAAQGNTTIAAANLASTSTSLLAAGLQTDGTLGDSGDLAVTTAGALTAQGQNMAGGSVALSGTSLDISGSRASAADLSFTATSGAINASRTTLMASQSLAATSTQTLTTDAAVISARQLNLAAYALSNVDGTILQTGNGSLSLNLAGALNNSHGTLASNGALNLQAASVNNQAGTIEGTSLQLQTHGNTLNNQSGTIAATGSASAGSGTVALYTGALNNDAGLIQATDSLVIHTSGQTLTNTHSGTTSGIFAKGHASLTTGDIANNGGFLAASGNLTISGANIANTGSTIASGGSLAISGNALDNSAGGQLQAVGDLTIAVGAGTINNAAGFAHANGNTQLSAASINNSNTSSPTQGIEGGNVTIQANDINNQNGSIRADDMLSVIGFGQLNNAHGLLSSANTLSIQDRQANATSNDLGKTLVLTNTGGTLQASQSVLIDSASLSFDGTVASQGSVTAKLLGDYTHTGTAQWQADGALSLALTGNFANTSTLHLLGDLRIDAANVSNTAQGQIAGSDVTLIASDTITNQGSVVGIDNLTLQAGQAIRNTGAGALLGAANSAGTLALLAPVIENRDDTTATDATPTTLIYGMGNVILAGGVDANGDLTRAQNIFNQSAQIESGANLLLAANQITNTRRELTVDSTFVAYGTPTSGQVVWTQANPQVLGGRYIEPPHGGSMNSDYLYTTYTQNTQRNSLTSISPEARIIAGSSLTFNTSLLQNYWSKVTATNDIALGNATVDQDSWRGATPLMQRTVSSGTYEYRTYKGYLWNNTWGPQTLDTVIGGYDSSIALGGTLSGNGATLYNGAGAAAGAQGSTGSAATPTALGHTPSSVASVIGDPSAPASPPTQALDLGQSSVSGTSVPTHISSPQNVSHLIATSTSGGNLTANTAGTVLNNITLPGNSSGLFHLTPNPGSNYLVETNPAFTNQQTWLSSDWYLSQLGLDPATTQKRLGDGFYEQRLVREQVLALTGRTQLDGYQNEQAQYQALLAAGVATAKAFDIRPGIALTEAQMASLTTDVVMLEERTVQGQQVLVPVLYLAHVQEGDLLPSGALIAASNIELYDSQGLVNRGTIRASNQLVLDSVSLDSRGGNLQSGGLTHITTRGDVDLSNAQLTAASLTLDTGGNLLLASTTTTSGYQISGAAIGTASQTLLERIASIDVQGDAVIRTAGDFTQNGARLAVGGNLTALVGGDWNLGTVQTGDSKQVTRVGRVSGAASSTGTYNTTSSVSVGGSTLAQVDGNLTAVGTQMDLLGGGTLAVKGNIDLSAATDRLQVDSLAASGGGGRSHRDTLHQDSQTLQGTRISAGQSGADSLSLQSGGDISLKASSITLTQGTLALQAAGDILIGTQNEHSELNSTHTGSHSTGIAQKSSAEAHSQTSDSAIGSSLGGSTVVAVAGHDLAVQGSNIVSDTGTTLVAGNNLAITAATNTASQNDFKEEKKSGLMSSGGIGFSIGKQQLSTDGQQQNTTATASTVAALSGGITLVAGQTYTQTGSDVLATGVDGNAATANISIQAQDVAITEARESSRGATVTKQSSSGLTLALSNPVVSALQGAANTAQTMAGAAQATSGDARMQALAAASVGLSAYNTYNAVADLAKDPGKAASVGISISLGSSKSTSTSTEQTDTAAGSSVVASGNVSIVATGAGKDSNLLVRGSSLTAGDSVQLQADNAVNLQAAQNNTEQHSANASSGASVGVSFTVGSKSGVSFQASANSAKGHADGTETTYSNTSVNAGNAVSITSGGDTQLAGATVAARTVSANVGGNLVIQSLQDSATYDSKQQSSSAGVSLCLPPLCYGASSVSASVGKSQINSNYQSVGTQSGLQTGDGGFKVNVKGDTTLTGGAITSTQAAVDAGVNHFQTGGTLTTTDLHNSADYQGSGYSIGASFSGLAGNQGQSQAANDAMRANGATEQDIAATNSASTKPTGSAGVGATSGSAQSTTSAGISGIAGNQDLRTGDAQTGIKKIFDADKVQKTVDAQVAITAAFGSQASKAVGNYAEQKLKEAIANNDQDGIEQWKEGGIYRSLAHAVIGGLTGGVSGAAGAGAAALSADAINQATAGLPDGVKSVVGAAIAAGIGAAVGGTAGAAAGFNEDLNNRQLHPQEINWIAKHSKDFAEQLSKELGRPVSELEAMQLLTAAGESDVDAAMAYSNGQHARGTSNTQEAQAYDAAKAFIASNTKTNSGFIDERGKSQNLFSTTNGEFYKPEVYGDWRNNASYRDYYWTVMGINLKGDNMNAQEQATYAQRQVIANEQAVKQALTLGVQAVAGKIASGVAAKAGQTNAATTSATAKPSTEKSIATGANGETAAENLAARLNNFYRDGYSPELIQQTYDQAAISSTHNTASSEVVLGKYIAGSSNSYEAVAQARGATYFSMSDWSTVQGQLGADKMWNINKTFLDQQMAQNKSFLFTADPTSPSAGYFTKLEFQHLTNNGYKIIQEGSVYHAIKK